MTLWYAKIPAGFFWQSFPMLKLYQEEPFDLVISDILMPEMNGIHMIKPVKEINPDQMIIVTSACEETQYHDDLANLGVSMFVLKPTNTQQMIQILYDACESIPSTKTSSIMP